MARPYIYCRIDTKLKTDTKDFGRKLIKTLMGFDPALEPKATTLDDRYQNLESLEAFFENWWGIEYTIRVDGKWDHDGIHDTDWKTSPKYNARFSLSHSGTNKKGHFTPGSLNIYIKINKKFDYQSLFSLICHHFETPEAILHYYSEEELQSLLLRENRRFTSGFFWPYKRIEPLKVMGGMTALGPDYIDFGQIDKMKKRGFSAALTDHNALIRVTDDIFDLKDNYEHFDARRRELISLLEEIRLK